MNAGDGTGSGVIYDTNGDIVTNNHVVSGHTSLSVTFNNGHTVSATVVGTDSADDLAVIHVNASGLTPATFAKSGQYQVAEPVLAIGSPLGLKQSVTSGLISGIDRTQQEPSGAYIANSVQTSAPRSTPATRAVRWSTSTALWLVCRPWSRQPRRAMRRSKTSLRDPQRKNNLHRQSDHRRWPRPAHKPPVPWRGGRRLLIL